MKIVNIIYWVSTALLSLMMLFSAYASFTSEEMAAGYVHLGFPAYFRIQLAIAKFLGVIAIVLPLVPPRIKEWAYFGFFIVFISAFIAHANLGDPIAMVLVALALLATSYTCYHLKKKEITVS